MIEIKIIAALLHDVSNAHGLVFNTKALRLTLQKVNKRVANEGIGFLTKALPRLGKAFDKALSDNTPLSARQLGFESLAGSELPKLLGEFFSRVLSKDGRLLPQPCAASVEAIRQVLYLFYKYKLPHTDEQEQSVVQKFEKTEEDIRLRSPAFKQLDALVNASYDPVRISLKTNLTQVEVAREAKRVLSDLFAFFDPKDIYPRHGPGAVATKQKLWDKYQWTNVSAKITAMYPLDEYFYTSPGHVCDHLDRISTNQDTVEGFKAINEETLPARVILVPKDSRGPRLISCEPVDFQWIQQGLGRAIVQLVESHPLTKCSVNFTDQSPNQRAALYGSSNGRYATLDLNEASDRVSVDLVRLLFPEHIYMYLEACRSSSTELPDGRILDLQKHAPMGSCLCFPVLALTVWSILYAAAPDVYTRERILVYGDDVIVPTAYAADAMNHLESFGLKINRDKSCTGGLFRESCGTDAFKGIEVTPVRLRTVWSTSPCPSVYSSWVAYANSFYDKRYFCTFDLIVKELSNIYDSIADDSMRLKSCPSLREVPAHAKPKRRRWNKNLQKFEFYVTDIKSLRINHEMDGWSMLLRYFAEVGIGEQLQIDEDYVSTKDEDDNVSAPFSVRSYTNRRASLLVRRWR